MVLRGGDSALAHFAGVGAGDPGAGDSAGDFPGSPETGAAGASPVVPGPGGAAVELVWIIAQQQGLAVQPVSPVFLYAHNRTAGGHLRA